MKIVGQKVLAKYKRGQRVRVNCDDVFVYRGDEGTIFSIDERSRNDVWYDIVEWNIIVNDVPRIPMRLHESLLDLA
jgi:hypothetical protein